MGVVTAAVKVRRRPRRSRIRAGPTISALRFHAFTPALTRRILLKTGLWGRARPRTAEPTTPGGALGQTGNRARHGNADQARERPIPAGSAIERLADGQPDRPPHGEPPQGIAERPDGEGAEGAPGHSGPGSPSFGDRLYDPLALAVTFVDRRCSSGSGSTCAIAVGRRRGSSIRATVRQCRRSG